MRTKSKPTGLEQFLGDRELASPISSKTLHQDLQHVLDELKALTGDSAEVNGALRSLLLQPIRQLAEDLAAIERMGRRERGQETLPFNTLSLLQRWLITPNAAFHGRKLPRRIEGWTGKGQEQLYELPRTIAGRDFVVWNRRKGVVQFRAWAKKFYEPKMRDVSPAPTEVVAAMQALGRLPRSQDTARLRLLLAYGAKRTDHPWFRIGAKAGAAWVTPEGRAKALAKGGKAVERLLPQSYVAATLPILGPKFGVRVKVDGDERLRVTWAGGVLLHESIRITDWIGSTAS